MAKLAGTYANERTLRISVRDGRPFLKDITTLRDLGSDTGGEEWPLFKIGPADWIARRPGATNGLRFRVFAAQNGTVEYLFYGGRVLLRLPRGALAWR